MRRPKSLRYCTAIVGAFGMLACADDSTDDSVNPSDDGTRVTTPTTSLAPGATDTATAGGTSRTSNPATQTLNDAQITSVAITANTGEVEQNNVAVMRAVSAGARSFAQDMVGMHMAAMAREKDLATNMMITPADNAVTQMLQATSEGIVNMLQDADASTFDAVYLNSQVDVHGQVLTLIDQTLMPQVQAQPLKDELIGMRATVVQHLDRARTLASATR